MSEQKKRFTPGEWFRTSTGFVKSCISDPAQTVAIVPGVCSEAKMIGLTEAQANANLIAAAPEMYELLEKLQKGHTYGNATWQNIERVLRKARGEVQE